MRTVSQRGIALITVLLVLSLATVAAVSMTARQQLDIRRTSNILLLEEAYAALFAAEEFAKALLLFDLSNSKPPPDLDGFGDYWNSELLKAAVQEVGNFKVTNFRIEDLQGRFNLNNLVNTAGQPSVNDHEGLQRILSEHGKLPVELADKVVDWIDTNPDDFRSGVESPEYESLPKPWLSPDRLMVSASEMNQLMGVNLGAKEDSGGNNKKFREAIRELILNDENKILIALPAQTPINVNTPASPDIYRAIVPGITLDDAKILYDATRVATESEAPFKNTEEFWNHPSVSKYPEIKDQNKRVSISTNSSYFLLRAEAYYEDLVVYCNTVFYRSRNPVAIEVVHRSYSRDGEI